MNYYIDNMVYMSLLGKSLFVAIGKCFLSFRKICPPASRDPLKSALQVLPLGSSWGPLRLLVLIFWIKHIKLFYSLNFKLVLSFFFSCSSRKMWKKDTRSLEHLLYNLHYRVSTNLSGFSYKDTISLNNTSSLI